MTALIGSPVTYLIIGAIPNTFKAQPLCAISPLTRSRRCAAERRAARRAVRAWMESSPAAPPSPSAYTTARMPRRSRRQPKKRSAGRKEMRKEMRYVTAAVLLIADSSGGLKSPQLSGLAPSGQTGGEGVARAQLMASRCMAMYGGDRAKRLVVERARAV